MPTSSSARTRFLLLVLLAALVAPAVSTPAAQDAAGDAEARPLDDRGLVNLTAFARLLGVVRWFHPSDESAAADWDRLAREGVVSVERARGARELAARLEEVFLPVAPSVRVQPVDAPLPIADPPPQGPVVVWRHYGLGGDHPRSIYRSERMVLPTAEVPSGRLRQNTDAAPLAGRRARLRALGRFDPPEDGGEGRAELRWSAVPAGPPAEPGAPPSRGEPLPLGAASIGSTAWQSLELTAVIPEEASFLVVELFVEGGGRAGLDEVTLERLGDGAPAEPLRLLANAGFEDGPLGLPPLGWEVESSSLAHVYTAEQSDRGPAAGRSSAFLERRPRLEVSPLPEDPWIVKLGGGLVALVPLSLRLDAEGRTLPRPATGSADEPGNPEAIESIGDDRAGRLAIVATAWNVFQHFHPYFDLTDPDGTRWPAALAAALRRAAVDDGPDAFRETLTRLLVELDDGHGGVFRPGPWGPLPLSWDWIDGRLVVTRVEPQAAGLRLAPGDSIVAIDGVPADQALRRAGELVSAATPQWRRVRALRDLARGTPGEQVRLEVEGLDGDTWTVLLGYRAEAAGWDVGAEPRPAEPITEVAPGVLYVDLTRAKDAAFEEALPRLAAADGVVFDLRGYPGEVFGRWIAHLVDEPVSSARWRVPRLHRPDRAGMFFAAEGWTIEPAAPRLAGRVAVLTDGRAVSAAETLLGIVEHYRLAEIFGGPTAGTNGNVNPTALPETYHLVWTGMRVDKHDGSPHHGVGIQPTFPVTRTREGVAAGRDEVLEAAVIWASAGGGPRG